MKKFFLANGIMILFLQVQAQAPHSRREESLKYFDQAATVLQHPRCLNCHPAGDLPTQGMDMHIHLMNVQRGPKDHGAVGMQCSACHTDKNNKDSGVPGAPHWALAPKDMAWQGLSKGDLCRRLKDSKKPNRFAGDKTAEEFIKHNAEDKLVAWGWDPGHGREPAPMTQKKFGELIAKWIQTGAECPE